MSNVVYNKWADLLKVMGHPIRIKIIESLLDNSKCVDTIQTSLNLPQATVSQHLALLRTKGIVQNKRLGARVEYSIADKRITQLISLLKGREFT